MCEPQHMRQFIDSTIVSPHDSISNFRNFLEKGLLVNQDSSFFYITKESLFSNALVIGWWLHALYWVFAEK